MGHEITHVVNGHLDFLFPGESSATLTELGAVPTEPAQRLLRQVIEWDADSMASSMHGIGRIRRGLAPFGPLANGSTPDPVESLFAWSTAVASVFLTWGTGSFAGVDLSSLPYPPVALRWFCTMATALSYVEGSWTDAPRDALRDTVQRSLSETLMGFAVATGTQPDIAGIIESADEQHSGAHKRLMELVWRGGVRTGLDALAVNPHLPV
jgi:hypothetical protein